MPSIYNKRSWINQRPAIHKNTSHLTTLSPWSVSQHYLKTDTCTWKISRRKFQAKLFTDKPCWSAEGFLLGEIELNCTKMQPHSKDNYLSTTRKKTIKTRKTQASCAPAHLRGRSEECSRTSCQGGQSSDSGRAFCLKSSGPRFHSVLEDRDIP